MGEGERGERGREGKKDSKEVIGEWKKVGRSRRWEKQVTRMTCKENSGHSEQSTRNTVAASETMSIVATTRYLQHIHITMSIVAISRYLQVTSNK